VAAEKPFPVGIALGTDAYNGAKTASENALARLEAWKDVSCSTDFTN